MMSEPHALGLNCTLKRSPQVSNTEALLSKVLAHMRELGCTTETIRVVDHDVMFGVSSDEGRGDEWPAILERVRAADILVMAMPIWFGVRSSVAQLVMERLDATYDDADPVTGQFPLYNKVGACVVTGNEDGAHDCCSNTLFNLTHLGCTVPPNADSYWVGEAGPGPSYLAAGGDRHLYTNRTARYLAANAVYMARLLKGHPIPTNLRDIYAAAAAESDPPRVIDRRPTAKPMS
jgi:multimeric flavodoxin WrbA